MSSDVLVIDGQVFQTAAWHRGMGKYSFALVESLKKSGVLDSYKKVGIVFNKNLSDNKIAKEKIKKLLPNLKVLDLNLEVPKPEKSVEKIQPINKQKIQTALEGAFVAEKVDFLILSLFIDEACSVFPDSARKLLLFYDLIPFLYTERYQNRINYQNYLDHFKTIFEAEMIFTISQTVANDNSVFLGINPESQCNIDGASIDRSRLSEKKPDFDIGDKFILMPSGDEIRKNNVKAVKGFEEFNSTQDNKYKLVITSRFSEDTKSDLEQYSENVIFTGNIPEENLQWLYTHAELLFFASEYEGLGLPILEGISTGNKIVCSNIPVFAEISNKAFFFFDEQDSSSIANGISTAVSSSDWEDKHKEYKKILEKYSWKQTAAKFAEGLVRLENRQQLPSVENRPRVAVFTPHPSGFSAIGKVVSETHYVFSQYFNVDYFFDYGVFHREVRPDFLSHVANCYEATSFDAKRYKGYDAIIYHIGNSDYHLESIKNALYLPGIVIFHDTFLNGAFESLEKARYITPYRHKLEEMIDIKNKTKYSNLISSVANNQLAIITHSEYAKEAVQEVLISKTPIMHANLPTSTPEGLTTVEEPQVRIGLAGIVADVKGLEIIEEIALSEEFKDCSIHVFGYTFAKPGVKELFKQWPHVVVDADPSDFEFQNTLSSLDILVNFRLEYRGETSLTVLEAMRYGVAVIVRGDVGWYAELPDEVVAKAFKKEDVTEKVSFLMEASERLDIGEKARDYTYKYFTHKNYTKVIMDAVDAANKSVNYTFYEQLKKGAILSTLKKVIS